MSFPEETVIIVGPTGAGKTDLSIQLALEIGGEIVGADAFQIYTGLPILTAQPTEAQQAAVPHHLIGSIDPGESFDAGRYQQMAEPVLHSIATRGKIPIVVGGTGLYVKALLGGLDKLPGTDPRLRKEFSQLDLPALVERLRTADAEASQRIDLANRRRVERALEIILLTGKPLACSRTIVRRTAINDHSVPTVRGLFVTRDRQQLHARIEANVAAMFARGVEEEVAALPEQATGPTAAMTLGLREIRALLKGDITRLEAMIAITTATRRYAKRQITWFKNQHSFPLLNLTEFASERMLDESLRLLFKKRVARC